MRLRVLGFEQECSGDFGTIVTLEGGRRFRCLRIELFADRVCEIDVRPDGAVVFPDSITGEPTVLVPVWLEGDPRTSQST